MATGRTRRRGTEGKTERSKPKQGGVRVRRHNLPHQPRPSVEKQEQKAKQTISGYQEVLAQHVDNVKVRWGDHSWEFNIAPNVVWQCLGAGTSKTRYNLMPVRRYSCSAPQAKFPALAASVRHPIPFQPPRNCGKN
jgi:hypothetical protein